MPLSSSLDGYTVWFVTGSQTLYGQETLRQVAEQSQQVAQGLQGLPVRVVWGKLGLRVNAYPTATLSLTLYTLSLEKQWLNI